MKLAFLYAGQGTQHVGMGRDLYETYPAFRAVLDGTPVDFDLKQLCFDGPEERLNDTRYTQPCMVAFAAGASAWGSSPPCTAPGYWMPPPPSPWWPSGARPWPTR